MRRNPMSETLSWPALITLIASDSTVSLPRTVESLYYRLSRLLFAPELRCPSRGARRSVIEALVRRFDYYFENSFFRKLFGKHLKI